MADQNPSLDDILQAAKRMQEHVEQAQRDLAEASIEFEHGGATIIMSGEYEVQSLHLSDDLVAQPKDQLEATLAEAYNAARKNIEKMLRDRLMKIDKKMTQIEQE